MRDDEFREAMRRALAKKARRQRTRRGRRTDPMTRAQLAPRYVPPAPRPIRTNERKR